MINLLDIAIAYRDMGLSVIATDALKQSIGKWKTFQERVPGSEELRNMFHHPAAQGIALVTGKSSGNLEAIDIDTKNFSEGCLFIRFCEAIAQHDADLFKKLVIAQSRSGGYHMYYRCREIESNQALARRPVTEEEKRRNPKEKVKVLIETRGIGGYIVVAPTPGYKLIQSDFSQLPEILPSERRILLNAARGLNVIQEKKIKRSPILTRIAGSPSPLDDYNKRGDVIGLLQKHGWTVTGQTSTRTFLKRPGDTDKRSSGSFNHELNYFSVFSTSTEFVPQAGYRPYAVYAMLECSGDFSLAYRKLSSEGFGGTSYLKTPQYKRLKI
ncbi:bifunctional DNA primase/polymerase [Niabella pedocola]|uniref:Bifunctional DNA primase/polymerase n=1 Tax=Niabella pedocola TaxID=1752077 RepID=A0ABS8PVU9_9BACT|nr:bifunctional DNA primase/polymerase [Niabella pedocola]MCD2424418.1 bifunctional DNA primase/polymerase [Niabella pedocola]